MGIGVGKMCRVTHSKDRACKPTAVRIGLTPVMHVNPSVALRVCVSGPTRIGSCANDSHPYTRKFYHLDEGLVDAFR